MMKKRYDLVDLLDKKNIWLRDLLLWTLVIAVFIVFDEHPIHLQSDIEIACYMVQMTLLMTIIVYSNNLLIIPLFKTRRFLLGIVAYILQVSILSFLLPLLFELISKLFIVLFHIKNWANWIDENISFSIIVFTVVASVFKIAKDNIVRISGQKETELRHLKNQLNPHFLFNTLNNLYGLSVAKSDKLPTLMLKLSELLRYSIYETEQTFVQLEKELAYIENYVELEKIRLNEGVNIEFTQSGDFSNQHIAPLMLIVFIENGFKHFSHKSKEQGYIKINLFFRENTLNLLVKNSTDPTSFTEAKKETGIGLTNVKKRLMMLYPNKHELNIKHEPGFHEVHLKIDLSL